MLVVSALQQRESAARLHVAPLVWISFPFRSSQSAEFPELCSRLSLVIYTVDSMYKRDISASLSQFIPPLSAGCPYICSLCLYFCFANKIIRTIFSRFHIHALIYFSDLIHSVYQSLGHVSINNPILFLFCLMLHCLHVPDLLYAFMSMDISVVSMSCCCK